MIGWLVHRYHRATQAGRVPGAVRWAARMGRGARSTALRAAQDHPDVRTPPYFPSPLIADADLDAVARHMAASMPPGQSHEAMLEWIAAARAGLVQAHEAPAAAASSATLAAASRSPEPPSVTIAIPTLDRVGPLADTLNAVEVIDYPKLELVVVNGPSRDGTADLLRGWAERAKLANCRERNAAMARNIALAHAAGDIVAFLDDDALPAPGWLEALVAPYADPKVGGVGGFILRGEGRRFQARFNVSNRLGEPADFPTRRAAAIAHLPGCARFITLTGCNSSFRRQALLAVGGFDETFTFMLEDTDICARVVDAGFDLAIAPGALVRHLQVPGHYRDVDLVPRSVYADARSKAYFCAKHFRGPGLEPMLSALLRYRAAKAEAHGRWQRRGRLDAHRVAALTHELDKGVADGLRIGFSRIGAAPAGMDASPPPPFLPFRPRGATA